MIISGKRKEMNGLSNNSMKTIIFSVILATAIQLTIGQSIEINPIKARNEYLVFKTGSIEIPTKYEYHYLSINIKKLNKPLKVF